MNLILPDLNFDWISEEVSDCFDSEMDFLQEAANSKRAKESFAADPKLSSSVLIPKVYDEFTSKRILTMEFIPGFKVNDLKSLKKAEIDPEEVNRIMYVVFMEMIFKHGFVHCDPHPGNILVNQDCETKKIKLVLLDNGLYKEIPKEITIQFSKLFIAILGGNEQEIRTCAAELNISPELMDKFLKLIQTLTAAAVKNLGKPALRGELDRFIENQTEESKKQATDALKTIPREMLFIIKILDLLRSNERQLTPKQQNTIGIYSVPRSVMIIYGYCMAKVDKGNTGLVLLLKLFRLI